MPPQTGKASKSTSQLHRVPGEVRAVVFEAAEELMHHSCVVDITVQKIIIKAGISRSTFYAHFSSKYHVLTALLDDLELAFDQALKPWLTGEGADPEAEIWLSLTAVSELWRNHPIMSAAAENWHMVPELEKRWLGLMNHYIDTIATRIDILRDQQLAPQGADSRAIAQVLGWGGERIHHVAGRNVLGNQGETDAIEDMMAVWLGAIYHLAPKQKS